MYISVLFCVFLFVSAIHVWFVFLCGLFGHRAQILYIFSFLRFDENVR